jgi:hypothetical protein
VNFNNEEMVPINNNEDSNNNNNNFNNRFTMVSEPIKDQRITVSYATKANFVDVKALKGNLWNEICRDSGDGKVSNYVIHITIYLLS